MPSERAGALVWNGEVAATEVKVSLSHTVAYLVDGIGGDVDAGPAAAQLFCGYAGGGAAAEGIQDYIALVAAGLHDALHKANGFCVGYPVRSLAVGPN